MIIKGCLTPSPPAPSADLKKHYLLAWTFVSLVKKTILIPPSTFTGAENSTNYCREIIYSSKRILKN